MKTKHLLTGLVLPALFAACTAEEIESSKGVLTQEDLSARPSVGNVVLNFGNTESRAELGDNAFNSIVFNADEDAIGARIIDKYAAAGLKDADGERVAWKDYSIINEYASSNYQYVYNGECWETTALMVEGNYMFYYPYNAKNVARGPLEIITPTHQVVKPNEVDGERNPIAELYAGENPAFVGYKFIDAKDQDLAVSVDMQHVFAYPQITLVNDFTTTDKRGREVETDLTITKIVLSSSDIVEKYTINHTAFRNSLTPEFSYLAKATDKKETVLIEAGNWTEAETLLKEATIDAIAKASNKTVEIEVEFEGGLELAYGDEYTFNVVLPAMAYASRDLKMQVYTEDDMMIGTIDGDPKSFAIAKAMTFAPGKRYATQEYNFPATGVPAPKKSAGNLAVYELGGVNLDLIDAVAPVAVINNIEEFEAYLETIGRNVEALKEIKKVDERDADADNFILAPALDEDGEELGYANLVVDEALLALLDEYNYAGNIEFVSTMLVKGAKEAPDAAKEIEEMTLGNEDYSMSFAKAIVTEGYVTANEYTNAEEVEVLAGVLTIADGKHTDRVNPVLESVVVRGGEAIVTDACFDASDMTASLKIDEKTGKVVSRGTVTLNFDGEVASPAVNGGYLTIGKKVVVNAASAWKNGWITNNGTIEADLTIKDDVTLTENGEIDGTIINDGVINANANIVVKENTGKIVLGDDLVDVTISDATKEGEIDNTAGGKVYGVYNETTNKQIVYATLTSLENDGDDEDGIKLSSKYDYHSGVTKYVLTGVWNVTEVTDGPEQVIKVPAGIDNNEGLVDLKRTIEFASGSSLKVASGGQLTLKGDVAIAADVTWSGRNNTASAVKTGDMEDIIFGSYLNAAGEKIFYNVVVKDLDVEFNPQEYLIRDALAEGGTATINADVTLAQGAGSLTMSDDVITVLNLNGKTIKNDYTDVFVVEAGNLTLKGDGTVIAASTNEASASAVWVKGNANTAVTIENGTYKVGGDKNSNDNKRNDLIYVGASDNPALGGTVTINNGTFVYTGDESATYEDDGHNYLLNCNDKAYLYKNAKIIVKGGKFDQFNPAMNKAEGEKTNFLAEGYAVRVWDGTTNVTNKKPQSMGETLKTFAEQYCLTGWTSEHVYEVGAE